MSAEILLFGGYVDGELLRDPSSSDYVAGMPAEVNAGQLVKLTTVPANYVGIFKNDKGADDQLGPQVGDSPVTTGGPTLGENTSLIAGTNKVRLAQGTLAAGTTDTPYHWPGSAHAWVEGDLIYISSTGHWDNQVQTGGDPAFGRVVKAPAFQGDDMHVYFYK